MFLLLLDFHVMTDRTLLCLHIVVWKVFLSYIIISNLLTINLTYSLNVIIDRAESYNNIWQGQNLIRQLR